ncbi:hypothetical protein [Roseibium salinum]|uniref:Uncharacterized protein n=1 Tax=Roseibium salinum TaxID=1604349 RepID=A0ABT3R065_9HYPH|nr:hypothetical protein [Roseibium sp. DSM 29163]MCX2722601.1 hypothetical protein [Roseibium sp. DSM 29163]MDN3719444.1 hypothetical protein [Roseibium salinum]
MDEDWISITEAAERLTKAGDVVTRSTLSRYLSKHGEALPTKRSGRETQVDYVRLRMHRSENIRIEPAVPTPAPIVKEPAFAGNLPGTKVNGAARKALADAELKELDLAQRRKQVTPTSEVDRAGRDAIALMNSSFERAVETEAASLSVKYGWDERTIRLALKKFVRTGLDVFHREILKSLDDFRRTADAPPIDGEQDGDQVTETLQ